MDSPFAHVTFLVLDGSNFALQLSQSVLSSFAVKGIWGVKSYDEAVNVCHHKKIDCVIVEWRLPDRNGLHLVEEIRQGKTRLDRETPILLCTAYSKEKKMVVARDSGVNDVLVKPFSVRTYYDKLTNILFSSRKFIFSDTFVGPDRRWRDIPIAFPDRRKLVDLDQGDIDKMFE